MSKVVIYVLDKAVWLLLATVITTQALQIAGIIETPKSASAFEYQHDSFNSHQTAEVYRWKRDASDTTERSQFIDMLFNIPIKTLTAVNNLIQNSRPAIRKLREFAANRFEKTTTKAPEKDTNLIQKRSYPVYIRPVGEEN